jgi:hypothetical protein
MVGTLRRLTRQSCHADRWLMRMHAMAGVCCAYVVLWRTIVVRICGMILRMVFLLKFLVPLSSGRSKPH